jgi:hypothetical protein
MVEMAIVLLVLGVLILSYFPLEIAGRRLASKGVSVRVLAELPGHSSIQTTQRYIDVNPQQMSAAVELL